MTQNDRKNKPDKLKSPAHSAAHSPVAPSAISRREREEDRMGSMISMIAASVGRLPAGLVMIFVIALSITAIMGLVMKYSTQMYQEKKQEIVRLAPDGAEIDPALVPGEWVAQSGDYLMSIRFTNKNYEWMIEPVRSSGDRYFSRGDWGVKGDVLVLIQREDLGYPSDPDKPYIRFMPITLKQLNIRVTGISQQMDWDIPSSEYINLVGFGLELFNPSQPVTRVVWGKN